MSVTIREVARRAGVSIKTISRVVNDQGESSEATHQRVLDADGDHEERLYVQPELVARGSCGAPGTVGTDAVQVA